LSYPRRELALLVAAFIQRHGLNLSKRVRDDTPAAPLLTH